MIFSTKYEKWYWALINRALLRDSSSLLGEKHHIFPQCVHGKNSFVVKLTLREHYLAHLFLAKIQGEKYPKLWLALTIMNKPGVYNSRLYAIARRKASELRSIKNRTEFDYSKVLPKLHKNNSKLQNRPWKNFNAKQENLEFWKKAHIVYDLYTQNLFPKGQMYSYLCNSIDLPIRKVKILRNMLKLIDSGWSPRLDEEWLQFSRVA